MKRCRYCTEEFDPYRATQEFCSGKPHRPAFHKIRYAIMHRKITEKDIAEMAGVSDRTVRRVFDTDEPYGPIETRQKVIKAATTLLEQCNE